MIFHFQFKFHYLVRAVRTLISYISYLSFVRIPILSLFNSFRFYDIFSSSFFIFEFLSFTLSLLFYTFHDNFSFSSFLFPFTSLSLSIFLSTSISFLFFMAADLSKQRVGVTYENIKNQFLTLISDNTFCDLLIVNIVTLNISGLNNPTQIKAINNICLSNSTIKDMKFSSVIIPYAIILPSSQPTNIIIESNKINSKSKNIFIVSSSIGIFVVTIIIFCCVALLLLLFCCSRSKIIKSHQYDILVLLNNNEELIFENIYHEDIISSRRSEKKNK